MPSRSPLEKSPTPMMMTPPGYSTLRKHTQIAHSYSGLGFKIKQRDESSSFPFSSTFCCLVCVCLPHWKIFGRALPVASSRTLRWHPTHERTNGRALVECRQNTAGWMTETDLALATSKLGANDKRGKSGESTA